MAANRVLKTSFPPVLSQYLPSQPSPENEIARPNEPEDEDQTDKPGRPKSVRVAETSRDSGQEGSSPQKGGSKAPGRVQVTSSQKQKSSLSLGSRSASSKSARRRQESQGEHFEHVAEVWDQARNEVLSERHVQLQAKVQLQHRLLKAQDLQARESRQRREQNELKKRQEEKKKKQTKEAALQDICRQSLEADKQKANGQRQGGERRSEVPSTPTTPPSSIHSSGGHDSDTASSGRARAVPRHPGYRPSMGLPDHQLSSSPMRELEDEADDEGGAPSSEMPTHHAQLYELYGKQADYFLYPKPAPAPPQKRPIHPKLRNPKGHIGAGELWQTLRADSMNKLIRNDLRFPAELKSTFGSFVRERLTKHCKPVERSFCATEDVPDIERLMDQSKLRHTRMYRHKTELMYRSSVNNRDRTSILMHNSPLPEVTEAGQTDSINRYLPSWLDDQSEVSEAEYMKWIRAGREQKQLEEGEEEEEEENKENARHSAHSRQLSETTNELQSIWHSIAARNPKPKTPRYQFLTEKEARCDGMFTQKFLDEKEQREKPQPHQMAKSYSAMELSHPSSSFSVPASRERGRSAHTSMQLQRYRSDWQPLSMSALVEYKKQMATEGEGEFDHGRMKMWPVVKPSVAC